METSRNRFSTSIVEKLLCHIESLFSSVSKQTSITPPLEPPSSHSKLRIARRKRKHRLPLFKSGFRTLGQLIRRSDTAHLLADAFALEGVVEVAFEAEAHGFGRHADGEGGGGGDLSVRAERALGNPRFGSIKVTRVDG